MRNGDKSGSVGRWRAGLGRVILCLAIMTGFGAANADAAANPPVVTGKALTRDTTPTWSWTSGGGGNGVYCYKLDSATSWGAKTKATSFTPVAPLSESRHVLYVKEQDATGKWSVAGNKAITIDLTPPNPPALIGKSPTRDATPTWTWLSGGGGGNGNFRYKLDNNHLNTGATLTAVAAFTSASPLLEGPHALYVQERDAAGNWSAFGKKAIVVDLTPPVAPVVSGDSPTDDPTPTWSWASGGGGIGAYRYKLDNSNLKSDSIVTTLTSFTPETALAEGEHTLYVQERDKAGNWSAAGGRAIRIAAAPPVASGRIPDTGQTQCYNNDRYNNGRIACPAPGQPFHGQDGSYTINPPSYTAHDNGTVSANATGLIWQQEDDGVSRSQDQALAYCQDLELAGYNDWRLPSKKELLRIAERTCRYPNIYTEVFLNSKDIYWTATSYAGSAGSAWYVSFGGCAGSVYASEKVGSGYARCVRNGQ